MRFVLPFALVISLSACVSTDFTTSVAAKLADDGNDYRPAIAKVVSEALGGRRVNLTTTALKSDSRLMIEPKAEPLDPFGNPMSGRLLDKPDDFTLRTVDGKCVLHHEDKDVYYPLDGVNCVAI